MPNFKLTRIALIMLFLIVGLTSYGQEIFVETLSIPKIVEFSSNQKLKFPVLRTSNPQIDKKINTDIINRFTNNEYPNLSIESTLIK